MTAPALRYPTAWSYSAYSDWALCPAKYEGKKVLKMAEPESPHLVAGNLFHQQIAHHITRPDAPLPERPIHARLQPVVAQLRGMQDKVVEQQWGFTAQWSPCAWFANGPNPTWLRVILDAGLVYEDNTAVVGDWKTGKRYDTNDEQMELFALATFAKYRQVNEVETRLWYVDNGHEETASFKKSEEEALRKKWTARATTMLGDRTFPKRPNDKCHFCLRAKSNGGDCQFG